MIAHLRGELIHKSPLYLIIDVNGVGYRVYAPLSTYYGLPELHQRVALKIHTQMSEDAIRLFGFLTEEEHRMFLALISISKIGPKMALAILSGISIAELTAAVSANDIARLSAVPGIGRKTAERVALEMKDKLAHLRIESADQTPTTSPDSALDDALSALLNLGYKKAEAEKALQAARKHHGPDAPLEDLIKESLKHLS
jgi:Holliday junction DNA helicase RuvA